MLTYITCNHMSTILTSTDVRSSAVISFITGTVISNVHHIRTHGRWITGTGRHS